MLVPLLLWAALAYALAPGPVADIRLTPVTGGQPEAILAQDLVETAPDGAPLAFQACFTTPLSQAMLTETYRLYDAPSPAAAAPGLPCFDAPAIADALSRGEALAFLSEPQIRPGIDRVIAVFSDGRAYAWHQPHAPKD